MFLVKPLAGIGYTPVNVLGRKQYREPLWFAVLAFAPVIIMATLRGDFVDTYAYRNWFLSLPDSTIGVLKLFPADIKDKGFSILSAAIKCFISHNDVVYFFIIAAFQGLVLIYVYRKYSINYLMSAFLFIASTDYMSWMFNGVRQFTAVTILFAATTFMLEKRWVPTTLLILLAATMHQSALLMFAIVIIAHGKAWNMRTLLWIAATIVSVLFIDIFTDILDVIMQETQYANMVSDWEMWGDDGTNALRVLVYSVPTILSAVGLRYIRQTDDKVVNFCTNMSIVSTGLYILSMFTSGIFIGRLPIYASLYNYILLPWEIENMFTKQSARIIAWAMVAAYMVFYYYQMHFIWRLI